MQDRQTVTKARVEKWQEYESPFYRRWRVYSTFLTGFAIGLFYVLLISERDFLWLGAGEKYAAILVFSGILGGVIYTIMVDGHVEMPQFIANRGDKFRAGLFGDILLGIAGATVLDVLVQALLGVELGSNVEIAAAGIVGGYGGRAILQFALERVFKDINLLEADRVAYLQANMQRRLARMDGLELIDLVNEQIKVGLAGDDLTALSREIAGADADVRRRIFNLVRDFRLAANSSSEQNRIARMVPIFAALVQSDPKQHEYYAELAFAYKDSKSPDLSRAIEYLDKAIALRGDGQRAQTWNYELSRAITRIQQAHKRDNSYDFNDQTEDLIIQDLLAVANIYNFETLLKDIESDNIPIPLLNWARNNQAELLARNDTADLAIKITNFLETESNATSVQPANAVISAVASSPSTLPKPETRSSNDAHVDENQKIDRSIFFEQYRDLFSIRKITRAQVNAFDAIFDYWDGADYTDLRWLAYAMATAYHETGGRMVPVREGFAVDDASAIKAVERLLARGGISWNYAKPEANGKSYFGRGLVQITHGENYLKLGKAIGLGTQLYDNPSLALDNSISVKLLFKGMTDGLYRSGHKLSVYFNQDREDWYSAREMINGDKHYKPRWANGKRIGELIAGYGRNFYRCCKTSALEQSLQSSGASRNGSVKHWMEAVQETWLKRLPDPVELVLPEHKKLCPPGKKYGVEAYRKDKDDHYFVTLAYGAGDWYILDSKGENHWDTTWENDHGEAEESGSHAAEKRLDVTKKESADKQPIGERLTKDMPFDTLITPHVTYGEFALYKEARRFTQNYQCKVAYEICLFLEKCREHFGGKPLVITSGYRPPAINAACRGASNSEHLYDHPEKGAVDFYIKGVNIYELQRWCDREYPHSIGYGAHRGFIHLGFRPGKERIRWPY